MRGMAQAVFVRCVKESLCVGRLTFSGCLQHLRDEIAEVTAEMESMDTGDDK